MAVLDDLTEDLLTDILSRIPAKSLLRSKSVSKHWYSLILNPYFISLHHTRAQPKYCIHLFDTHVPEVSISSMALVPNEIIPLQYLDLSCTWPHLQVVFSYCGSCNGLICLSNIDSSNIVIWNPAIRECRPLPPPPYHTWRTGRLGFVFDSKTNDYKVVRFATLKRFDADTPAARKVHIYSMRADSWNEIVAMVPNDDFFHSRSCASSCATSDGVYFYWLCFNYSTSDYSTRVAEIVTSKMGEGVFKKISMPTGISFEFQNVCLLNDSLALVALSEDDEQLGGERVDIWVMDENGVEESWTKKYTFRISAEDTKFGFLPNSEVLLIVFNHRQFVSYHLSTHDTKEYNPLTDLPDSVYLANVFPYSESLVTLKRRVD